jgi:hypothetical protein
MTAGVAAPAPARSRTAPIAIATWFVAALVLGPWLFTHLPFPGPQLIVLAVAVAAAFTLSPWLKTLSWPALFGMHALRLIGIWFLILGTQGLIASSFATRAGWGDIVAALGAIGLAVAGPRPKSLAYAWNTFGLLDLIVAVATATLVVSSGAIPGVEPLTRFPLNLVPTFFVPFFIATHIAIYRKLHAA